MATSSGRMRLVETDIPGVFRNARTGHLCNESGVRLSFATLKKMDEERWVESIGKPVETPAELLKAVALDPRMHLDVRLSAAKQAAPYYDAKMPLKVEASGGGLVGTLDLAKLAAIPAEERKALLELLRKVGVEL
jgi:hypothetical protein